MEPYSEAEIGERRANPLCVYVNGMEPYLEPKEARWLATLDALQARLAAAEGLLAQARRCVDQTIELGWESSEELLERIDAHLAAAQQDKPLPIVIDENVRPGHAIAIDYSQMSPSKPKPGGEVRS